MLRSLPTPNARRFFAMLGSPLSSNSITAIMETPGQGFYHYLHQPQFRGLFPYRATSNLQPYFTPTGLVLADIDEQPSCRAVRFELETPFAADAARSPGMHRGAINSEELIRALLPNAQFTYPPNVFVCPTYPSGFWLPCISVAGLLSLCKYCQA